MPQDEAKTIDGPEIYVDNLSAGPVVTGDLFLPIIASGNSELAGVVLTPLCDLVQEKTEWVKLAVAYHFQTYLEEVFIPQHLKGIEKYRELIENDPTTFGKIYAHEPDKRDDTRTLGLVRDLQRIFENFNPLKDSHFYLPGKDDRTQGFLVDFSHVFPVPFDYLNKMTPRLRLQSPWREQLLNRYVSYSLRIGTLDYSKSSISETIRAFFPELTTEQITKKMK